MKAASVASVSPAIVAVAQAAKEATRRVAFSTVEVRNRALEAVAEGVEQARDRILTANAEDVRLARAGLQRGDLSSSIVERLKLSPEKLASMIAGVRAVAALPDPIGRVLDRVLLDNGLVLEKVSQPLGLLAIIFEARPEAVTQISSLAIKSGNAVILKPGREVEQTARVLVEVIRQALREHAQIPEALVTGVHERTEVDELLKLDGVVDLVIPRGSYGLVRHVQSSTRIPVLGHSEGICHIYVDASAEFDMALNIIDDAKTDYPAACNAVETVLLHESIAQSFLPLLWARMTKRGVRMRGCAATRSILAHASLELVRDEEWHTEYSDLVLAVKVVKSVDDAIAHIARYGSGLTDAIIAEDAKAARKFLDQVDSTGVYHNCSTRFNDGFRYGFGAEVGISTSRIHARGPVGLDGLTTYKYILRGHGHMAHDYQGPDAKRFLHERLPCAEPGSIE
jgi:glutamate-5-semialdehyde dehydrogenase